MQYPVDTLGIVQTGVMADRTLKLLTLGLRGCYSPCPICAVASLAFMIPRPQDLPPSHG